MENTINKNYIVYKVTSPDGKIYVGFTSQELKERWRQHRENALLQINPERLFYNEIRRYSGEGFTIEALYTTHDKDTAMLLEEECILAVPDELSLNMTRGGRYDGTDGSKIFWERINSEPMKRMAYLKKLSDIKKANDWSDYESMSRKAAEWRKLNPREAYKLSHRAARIANKMKSSMQTSQTSTNNNLSLKDRLMHKFRLNEIKSEYVTGVWNHRTKEERDAIAQKISDAQIKRMSSLSIDERRAVTAKAREAIDTVVQGVAASKGLKKWWEELKQDPERYKSYMEKRTISFKKNRALKKNDK